MSGIGKGVRAVCSALSAARIAAVLAALILIGGAGPALAQTEFKIMALDPAEATEKEPNPAPAFQALIKGVVPGLAADQFVLKQDDLEPPLAVKAEKVKRYTESNHKMAMVVLIQGNGYWMGNESYADEAGEVPVPGAFSGLGAAIETLGKAGPPGSLATVLIYGDGKAEAKYPIGPAEQLSGSVLGAQKDYQNNLDFPLIVGLDEAITVFDNHAGYRKILVVFADGTGEREDISKDLGERVEKLQQRSVETYSVFYGGAEATVAGQGNMRKLGYTGNKNASSKDNFETFAQAFVDDIGARYYVLFPGCDAPAHPRRCFSHDGATHDFIVAVGEQVESEPISVQTKLWNVPPPPEESSLWWLWLLLVLLVVGIIVLIVVVKSRKEEIVQPPPLMPDLPPPPPNPVASKTMILGIGGNDGGMPIVGWLVPLSGPNQFQTFKLEQGSNKIGSSPEEATVIIQDHFMSGAHCEIIVSATGFMLKDGGSTNGTYLNNNRVSTHELVDNDVLTMGKTNFKFKSIN